MIEVVRIAEKRKKATKKLKNESTLYASRTESEKKKSLYKGKYYYYTYRLVLILDGIETHSSLYGQRTDFFSEHFMDEILGFLTFKYSSKIIYALNRLKFASFWELSRLLNFGNMAWIRKFVFRMEQLKIVKEIHEKEEEHQVIKAFWKIEYPTAPKFPMLFCLEDWFSPIAEGYSDIIMERFVTKREYNMIENRRQRYESHSKSVRNQLKLTKEGQAESIGTCIHCSRHIHKSWIKGKDYVEYKAGIVCRPCMNKATKHQIRKWTQKR